MKSLFILCLSFLLNYTAIAQWTDVSIPQGITLNNGAFTDDLRGYVTSNASVWRTLDGGMSWDSTNFSANVVDVDFSSPMNGVLLLRGGNQHSLKVTSDGGDTWTTVNFPNGPFDSYYQILSTSVNNYFLVSFNNILTSMDAGVNWDTILVAGYPYANDKEKINSDTLIFTGWDGTFNYEGAITYSYDGGNSWTFLATNDSYTNFDGTHFKTGMKGYGIYHSGWAPDTSYLAMTLDGGINWNTIHFDTSTTYHDVYIKNNVEGYILTTDPTGTQGKIISTTDGINWNDELTGLPSMKRFYHAENTLWAIGDSGTVVKKNLPLGIKTERKNYLEAFPNPVTDYLQLNNQDPLHITITDIKGTLVFEKTIQPSEKINFEKIPAGLYFLKYKNEIGTGEVKLIKIN